MRNVTVYRDLFGAGLETGQFDWTPFVQPGRSGVWVEWLYTAAQTGATGAEACIARYAPGAHSNLHEHEGFEVMFVLEGELHNDNGDIYPTGTLIVELPHSVHQLTSPGGCALLIVREKGMSSAAKQSEIAASMTPLPIEIN